MSDKLNCECVKPSYEELERINKELMNEFHEQCEINSALSESLRLIYNNKKSETDRADYAEQHCSEENKRANKLFDIVYDIRQAIGNSELDVLEKINRINVILGEED